jgi:hypothetical protein
LTDFSGAWIDRARYRRGSGTIVPDIDSSVSSIRGDREGGTQNGHFGCTRHHPLFVINRGGDLERCRLRPGHIHSAERWRELLEPVIAKYRVGTHWRQFRADAAFASPEA